MNISEIFIKGRKVYIKKHSNSCIEIHHWIIIAKNKLLFLKRISDEQVLYNLEKDDDIEFEINSPSGVFVFKSKIIEIISENEIKAEIPSKLLQMSRRAYKRIEVVIPIEIIYNNNKNKGAIMDLSEGGAFIISNEEFHVGNLIKLNFIIAEKKILIEVYIKRKEKFMQGLNLKKYGYGIEFSELGEEFNTIIRDYIYSIYKK